MDSVPVAFSALALGIVVGASANSFFGASRGGGDGRLNNGRTTYEALKVAVLAVVARVSPFLVCILGERRAKEWYV